MTFLGLSCVREEKGMQSQRWNKMASRKGYTRACNMASNYDSISEDEKRDWSPEGREKMEEISVSWHAKCSGYIGTGKSRRACKCKCHNQVEK